MKILILIFLLLLPTSVHAEDKSSWTWTDTGLEATYLTLHAMDWSQTLHIARNPQTYSEMNSILGPHPSTGRVNSYYALTGALHVGAAYFLPKPYRTVFQSTWIIIEYDWVQHNRRHGIGISLRF